MSDNVWITGVGGICSLGFDFNQIADHLLAGRSGIRHVQQFDVTDHPAQIAGEVPHVPHPSDWDAKGFAQLERVEQMLIWCCSQALRDADLWEQRPNLRIGLSLGLGAEWPIHWENSLTPWARGESPRHPDFPPLLDRLQDRLGIHGPKLSIAAACASANHALEQGRRWVERGWADVCLAGGVEAGLTPMSLAAFGNLRALSRQNDHPERASRPFDVDRQGFVMGEGGGVFLLERESSARNRAIGVHAEVAGFGATSDAHHMIIPSTDPEPAANAVTKAITQAKLNPEQIGYVNAHATSTPVGDVGEARSLHVALGDAVRKIPVSSTKSMTGHLLSGAAGIETLACLVALKRQAIPPTINLDNPDPECDLCHVANHAEERTVDVTLSNSFGFGGSNTCLILRRVAQR